MNESIAIAQKLLKSVHHYYPVGLKNIWKASDGYRAYQAIMEQKMTSLIEKRETPHTQFLKEMANLPEKYVGEEMFPLSPSYLTSFNVENKKDENSEFRREVILGVSLLSNFYTVFVEDTYRHRYGNHLSGIAMNTVVFLKGAIENSEIKSLIDQVHIAIRKSFPEHEYVNHRLLFDYQIEGSIIYGFGEDLPGATYTFYEHLFYGQKLFEGLKVLE